MWSSTHGFTRCTNITISFTLGITRLYHKAITALNLHIIVKSLLYQVDKVSARHWCCL